MPNMPGLRKRDFYKVKFGFHRACVGCPASLICLTEDVWYIFIDGAVHVSRFVFHFDFHGHGLINCPFARREK